MVLVHTMGRVGSSTVYRSLQAAGVADVRHIHVLNPATIAQAGARAGAPERMARSVQDAVTTATDLLRHPGRVKVVTLVRDAADRNLSAAFADRRHGLSPEDVAAWLSDRTAVQDWWDRFYDQLPFHWFEREVEEPLGLDVYSHSFPDEGWCILMNSRTELLIMRSELDDAAKSLALETHVGVNVPLVQANLGSRSQQWLDLYRQFRTVVGESQYRESLADTHYQRHFYRTP